MKNLPTITPTYQLPSIKYDLQPLKAELETLKEHYGNWVVSENKLKEAKDIRKELNKSKKKLDRQRIDLMNEITKPLSAFETELKDIAKEIEMLSKSIDSQVKDYEQKEKDEKKQEIKQLEHWQEWMVFNEKWLNKTYSINDIEKELKAQENQFSNNSLLITQTCKAYELNNEKYFDMLKNKQDIETIIAMINNDYKTKQEYTNQEIKEENIEPPFEKQDLQDTETLTYTLKLFGTKAQLKSLRQFIEENGIEYEKVE